MIKKHGSEQAWRKYMSELGKLGRASVKKPTGYAVRPELAAENGRLGGLKTQERFRNAKGKEKI